jgi:uncharacterized protein YhbP (UPF0306 family)
MYVFLPGDQALVFSSERSTRHIAEARLNTHVSGTILPTKMESGVARGIQFNGHFKTPSAHQIELARKVYYSKFPFALLMKGDLWMIELSTIKMTDNTLGFGKKLLWNKLLENEN